MRLRIAPAVLALTAPFALRPAANDSILLFRTGRSLTIDPGPPGRPWYRHRIHAPGGYHGLRRETLPGIREAVESGKPEEAGEQAGEVIQVLRSLTDQRTEAAKLLKEL